MSLITSSLKLSSLSKGKGGDGMPNIFPARGCLLRVEQVKGDTTGFYKLTPPIGNDKTSPVLLLGADISEMDVLTPKTTLGGKQIIFLFGKSFGSVSIHGAILLGNSQTGNGAGMRNVIDWFTQFRTATKKEPVQLSVPGGLAYSIYLQSLAIGQLDPKFNVQNFVIGAIPAETNSN